MMNILIIGNGFDLAHNLPTKYNDFLGFIKYFKKFYNSNPQDIQNLKSTESFRQLHSKILDYLVSDKIMDKNNKFLNELYKLCSNNIWIDYFEKCIKESSLKGENWIDFESEIGEVVMSLECLSDFNKEKKKLYNPKIEIPVDEERRKNAITFF